MLYCSVKVFLFNQNFLCKTFSLDICPSLSIKISGKVYSSINMEGKETAAVKCCIAKDQLSAQTQLLDPVPLGSAQSDYNRLLRW